MKRTKIKKKTKTERETKVKEETKIQETKIRKEKKIKKETKIKENFQRIGPWANSFKESRCPCMAGSVPFHVIFFRPPIGPQVT